jgi:hypothetical protein
MNRVPEEEQAPSRAGVGHPFYGAAMTNTELIVEGEPAHLILEALQVLMASGREEDDMVHLETVLVGDSGAALAHALGRVTAELCAEDMRSFLPGGARTGRTEDQRRHDAMILLIERIVEAMSIDGIPRPLTGIREQVHRGVGT